MNPTAVTLLLIALVVLSLAVAVLLHRDGKRREIERYQTMIARLSTDVTRLRHKVEDLNYLVTNPGHGTAPLGKSVLDEAPPERDAHDEAQEPEPGAA